MIDFSYKSKNCEITINVYRHILFISLTSALSIDIIDEVVQRAEEAQNILNNKFAYWGTVYAISSNFKIDETLIEYIKSALNTEGAVNRKALAIVYEDEKLLNSKVYETLKALPIDVESMTFDMFPQALAWIDDVLNNYASKMYFRK